MDVYTKQSLDALSARVEELGMHCQLSITEAHRIGITAKFANKSLNELNEIVGKLNSSEFDCQE